MNEVVHTSPTIGSNVEEVVWRNMHFLMWDIGGQESLRTAWNTYFTNSQVREKGEEGRGGEGGGEGEGRAGDTEDSVEVEHVLHKLAG